jgi:colicin import membrane protein
MPAGKWGSGLVRVFVTVASRLWRKSASTIALGRYAGPIGCPLMAAGVVLGVTAGAALGAGTPLSDTTHLPGQRYSALGPAGLGVTGAAGHSRYPKGRSAQTGRDERRPPRREPQSSDGFRGTALRWFEDANRTYQRRIVPRLSLGGQSISAGARPRVRARVVKTSGPRSDGGRSAGWNVWLAFSHDTYDDEIVPRLTGKRQLGGLTKANASADDQREARLRRERDERQKALREAAAERLRSEQERRAAEAARRRAELERARLEAEHNVRAEAERRAAERRRAEQLAAAAQASAAAALQEADRRSRAEVDKQKIAAEQRARDERERARLALAALEEAWRRQEKERAERAQAERARERAAEGRRLAEAARRLEKYAAERTRQQRAEALRARRLARLARLRRRADEGRTRRRPGLPERRPFTSRADRPGARVAAAVPLPEPRQVRPARRTTTIARRRRSRGRRVALVRPVVRPRARSRKLGHVRRHSRSCRRRAGRRVHPPGVYVVRRGDSLWRIARRHYALGRRYRRIWKANRRRIAKPRLIYPCQRLFIPRRRRR